MAIYAIADLHLALDERVDKPMDIFGRAWQNHTEELKKNWLQVVGDEDTVLIPGDISWGLKLEETMADLEFISSLPGKKIISKGNHDLWWSGIGKLNSLFDNISFLHNNFVVVDGVAICGTRGWNCPGSEDFGQQDKKIYNREVMRLELSLKLAREAGYEDIIGVLHFPPTNDKKQPSDFTRLFEEYNVKQVVYGHLHGDNAKRDTNNFNLNGVDYRLISLDRLRCKPLRLR